MLSTYAVEVDVLFSVLALLLLELDELLEEELLLLPPLAAARFLRCISM